MATKKELETRFYPVEMETREEGDLGIISGRPIVFGSRTDLGWFDEIIMPGALNETNLDDVRLCLNHDTGYVYARSRRNNPNSTMQLMPDAEGLRIQASLNVKGSPKAQDYFSAVSRGDMDKMSFMFSIDAEEWENLESDHPLRKITKIGSVVEVSCVTFPAYNATDISARSKEALENARLELENAREQRAKEVETSDELALLKAKISLF